MNRLMVTPDALRALTLIDSPVGAALGNGEGAPVGDSDGIDEGSTIRHIQIYSVYKLERSPFITLCNKAYSLI